MTRPWRRFWKNRLSQAGLLLLGLYLLGALSVSYTHLTLPTIYSV